jgi:nitrogen regulatory protein P-II 2
MDTVPLKLVTVIAEAYLESRLLEEIKALGAKGYSMSEVRGEGSRGVRASEWEGRNVKIETLVSADLADLILQHVAANYFPNFAVVAFLTDVRAVRGEKYV